MLISVSMPPAAGHLIQQPGDVGVISHIGRERDGAGFGGERLQPVGAAGDGKDRPAFCSERTDGGLADSGAGAGNIRLLLYLQFWLWIPSVMAPP